MELESPIVLLRYQMKQGTVNVLLCLEILSDWIQIDIV